MKNKTTTFFALVTATGLQALETRELDPSDRRLDGAPGTVGMEILADKGTGKRLVKAVRKALRRRDYESAMEALDSYLKPWRVLLSKVSTGNRERDEVLRSQMATAEDACGYVSFPLLEN